MNFTKLNVGDTVLIIEDVRQGGSAKGQTAVYEGHFPLSVALSADNGETWKDVDYEWYIQQEVWVKAFPLWTGGEHGTEFAMPLDNPRFVLGDGSKIWGAECWWTAQIDKPLEKLEQAVAEQKDFIRAALEQKQ